MKSEEIYDFLDSVKLYVFTNFPESDKNRWTDDGFGYDVDCARSVLCRAQRFFLECYPEYKPTKLQFLEEAYDIYTEDFITEMEKSDSVYLSKLLKVYEYLHNIKDLFWSLETEHGKKDRLNTIKNLF